MTDILDGEHKRAQRQLSRTRSRRPHDGCDLWMSTEPNSKARLTHQQRGKKDKYLPTSKLGRKVLQQRHQLTVRSWQVHADILSCDGHGDTPVFRGEQIQNSNYEIRIAYKSAYRAVVSEAL